MSQFLKSLQVDVVWNLIVFLDHFFVLIRMSYANQSLFASLLWDKPGPFEIKEIEDILDFLFSEDWKGDAIPLDPQLELLDEEGLDVFGLFV